MSRRWRIKDNRKEKTLISKGFDIPQIKTNHLKSCDFFVFDSPLTDVALLLSLDTAGMFYERSIAYFFGS